MISMVRTFKNFGCLVVLAIGLQQALSFSLLGPFEPYQTTEIYYRLPGDLGGPLNLAEEYRRNTPTMYYAMDANFLEYFGANGSNAIWQAFDILNGVFDGRNNGVTNVSGYSTSLSEWPMEAHEYNYLAQALQLTDLKSYTLGLLVENLGLAEPDRYTWTLHDRIMGTPCPQAGAYTVIKRNFDPVFGGTDQLQPSSYVNGTLFTYYILELCTGTPWLADAVEVPVDPLANSFTAVAAFGMDLSGGYYTGLTRDDIGGLRYLLRSGNRNIEPAGEDTVTFITNNAVQLLFTSNLTALVESAYTNDAGALTALFPNLQIASTTQIFTNLVTTNTVFYFTNYPWSPAGSLASVASVQVVTTNVAIRYRHEFANVITNTISTNGLVTVITTNTSPSACPPFTPAGYVCTVVSQNSYLTNGIFGDYYIIPTNGCGFSIVATQLVQAVTITNATLVATNDPAVTNVGPQEFSQTTTYTFNQHVFQARLVTCPENSVALREGMERIQFEKRDFDSLLNRFFYPVTNTYTLYSITNNTRVAQTIRRVLTAPDFLITAEDLVDVPGNPTLGFGFAARNLGFDGTNANPNLAGPGVLTPGTVFTFNKVGPAYLNPGVFFLTPTNGNYSELTHSQILIWGSFDGTTNAPVVYPNGTDLTNLENQVFINLNPTGPVLPDGTLGVNYSGVFSGFSVASGGTPPYTWSLATDSPGLPPGLVLNASTGQITGLPVVPGTYDFVIRMRDAGDRYVDRPYTITIQP
jgi:hypothetical protein